VAPRPHPLQPLDARATGGALRLTLDLMEVKPDGFLLPDRYTLLEHEYASLSLGSPRTPATTCKTSSGEPGGMASLSTRRPFGIR
jgi:hypothetical protein